MSWGSKRKRRDGISPSVYKSYMTDEELSAGLLAVSNFPFHLSITPFPAALASISSVFGGGDYEPFGDRESFTDLICKTAM